MGGIGDWFKRAFTPSDSDSESGAQYNRRYNESQRQAATADIGNLTEDEAKNAASSRAFRLGTYFTSPTGALKTSPRRGAKLIGS